MKNLRLFLTTLTILIASLFISSCDDSTEPPQPCETYAEPIDFVGFLALQEPYQATYTVTKTGDAAVNIIKYTDDEGEHTINNPELPWAITVTVTSNDTKLALTANGTSNNGGIESKINATDGTRKVNANNSCSHENK